MSKRNQAQEIEVTVTPTELALKAKGLLAIKLSFVAASSLAHLFYDFWWLRIDVVLALMTYLLSVVIFVVVFTFCWNKTFVRTAKRSEQRTRSARLYT